MRISPPPHPAPHLSPFNLFTQGTWTKLSPSKTKYEFNIECQNSKRVLTRMLSVFDPRQPNQCLYLPTQCTPSTQCTRVRVLNSRMLAGVKSIPMCSAHILNFWIFWFRRGLACPAWHVGRWVLGGGMNCRVWIMWIYLIVNCTSFVSVILFHICENISKGVHNQVFWKYCIFLYLALIFKRL